MAKIYDSIEIGLTRSELRQALRCWMGNKTSIFDYTVTDVTLHPSADYVVRFKVEPPVAEKDRKPIETGEKQAAE